MNIDFARPFQFVFEDKDWMKKVLLSGLCFFIPIVGIFSIMGLQRRIIKMVADGNDTVLPEPFEGFGENIVEGLKMFCITLAYMAPGLFLYIGFTVLGIIVQEAAGARELGGFVALAGTCLGFPLLMIGALLSPVGILMYVDTDRMGAAFSIGSMMGFVKNNAINILLGIVIGMVAQFAAQFGLILCIVGVYFTLAWAIMVQGHAWGQVLRISRSAAVPAGSPAGAFR